MKFLGVQISCANKRTIHIILAEFQGLYIDFLGEVLKKSNINVKQYLQIPWYGEFLQQQDLSCCQSSKQLGQG